MLLQKGWNLEAFVYHNKNISDTRIELQFRIYTEEEVSQAIETNFQIIGLWYTYFYEISLFSRTGPNSVYIEPCSLPCSQCYNPTPLDCEGGGF